MLDLNKELNAWAKNPKLESLLELLIDYLNSQDKNHKAIIELREKFKLLKDLSKDLETMAELTAKMAESIEALEDQTEHLLS